MFKNNLQKPFSLLRNIYNIDELILVGSDIPSWLKTLQINNVEKVHYINQNARNYDSNSLPQNWHVSEKLLSKEDGDVTYYELTNSLLNGTVSSEVLSSIWKNLETLNTTQTKALSLKSFVDKECALNTSKMLVIDSFDGLNIFTNLNELSLDVVAVRVVLDEERFNFVSEAKVEQALLEWGYKEIANYTDNHPKIKTVVYVRDLKKKTKDLQENSKKERIKKETLQKELSEIKIRLDSKTRELTTANQIKEQELSKLRAELEVKTKHLQENSAIINSFATSQIDVLNNEYLNSLNMQDKIEIIVSNAIRQKDILDRIDYYVLGNELNTEEKFLVCYEFAKKIAQAGDKPQGISFLNNAKLFLSEDPKKESEQYKKLILLANNLHLVLAVDLEMEYNAKYGIFADNVNKRLYSEYKNIRSESHKQQQHGHDLIIDYINKNIKDGKGKVLVEIGTTRENVPGQGSTLQLAALCKQKGIKFITVDMDPHNTRWANFISKKYDLNIEAITSKGEDFLKHDIDSFDFVFLDAYDFDHGHHSELRQSRYEKYLGSKIIEKKAHKMHLKCAKSVVKKLKKDGALCVDDTWQDKNGEWAAKGTTAIPYLLNREWSIIDQRNNAVLIRRKK